jgi:hypothetical protein
MQKHMCAQAFGGASGSAWRQQINNIESRSD